jgi:hypothetical protein
MQIFMFVWVGGSFLDHGPIMVGGPASGNRAALIGASALFLNSRSAPC